MSRKITKDELCSSCREIRPVMNDGSLGCTMAEWLDSKGYNDQGFAYIMMNHFALTYLRNNGGCSRCINLFERAIQ